MSYPTSIAEGLLLSILEPGISVKLGEIINMALAFSAPTLMFNVSPGTLSPATLLNLTLIRWYDIFNKWK